MSTFLYFAYGSNMLSARLTGRCPSANRVGLAKAIGWEHHFSKKSIDESGKATLVRVNTSDAAVQGVLFEICITERDALDEHEGSGYQRSETFEIVQSEDGQPKQVTTYLAIDTLIGLEPYDWYLALIIAGGIENGIDSASLKSLRKQSFKLDANEDRKGRRLAIEALRTAGHTNWRRLLNSE